VTLRQQGNERAVLAELRRVRVQGMLRTLEQQLERGRLHQTRMAEAVRESASWANPDDRAWARAALAEAVTMRREAEQRLQAGRRIVAESWPLEVAR
jgi:hypothetical protein